MSPAQTSGLDSYGWRLRCPFSLSADLLGGAEDSYGIEGSSSSKSSKVKGEGPAASETGAEACRQGRSGQGRAGQSPPQGRGRIGICRKGCGRRQAPDQQCRGDQGGRHQGRRQG